jgi:uncharacterized membrane protein
MSIRSALFVSCLLLAAACTSGASSTGIEQLSCSPDNTLTYENFGQEMITTQCMSCHDTESPALGSLAQVRSHASQVMESAVYTDAMPEGGTLSLEERRLLGEWLACGAP